MRRKFPKIIYFLVCFLLIFEQSGFAQVAGQMDISSYFTGLRNVLIQDKFRPLHLRYLAYDNINNNFKLLLDKGDFEKEQGLFPKGTVTKEKLESSTKELLNYFFIGISLPDDSFWVNLRPDSPDNIIDPYLAQTDVGKILLEADLQLKKDTSLATSPQTPEGRVYWGKLYKKAGELFGTESRTIPTLTRPWIVPGEIIIRESTDNAYIYKATLKVMLESDYLNSTNSAIATNADYSFKDERLKKLNEYSSQLIRDTIIPKLTREVNTAKRYAPLRQVYYSLIFAQWFKQKFYGKSGLYSYLINKKNLTGLTSKEPWSKTTYFQAYQKSFKEGEYNIKEPVYTLQGQSIRSYMSGGLDFSKINIASSPINSNRPFLSLTKPYTSSPINALGGTTENPFSGIAIMTEPAALSMEQKSASLAIEQLPVTQLDIDMADYIIGQINSQTLEPKASYSLNAESEKDPIPRSHIVVMLKENVGGGGEKISRRVLDLDVRAGGTRLIIGPFNLNAVSFPGERPNDLSYNGLGSRIFDILGQAIKDKITEVSVGYITNKETLEKLEVAVIKDGKADYLDKENHWKKAEYKVKDRVAEEEVLSEVVAQTLWGSLLKRLGFDNFNIKVDLNGKSITGLRAFEYIPSLEEMENKPAAILSIIATKKSVSSPVASINVFAGNTQFLPKGRTETLKADLNVCLLVVAMDKDGNRFMAHFLPSGHIQGGLSNPDLVKYYFETYLKKMLQDMPGDNVKVAIISSTKDDNLKGLLAELGKNGSAPYLITLENIEGFLKKRGIDVPLEQKDDKEYMKIVTFDQKGNVKIVYLDTKEADKERIIQLAGVNSASSPVEAIFSGEEIAGDLAYLENVAKEVLSGAEEGFKEKAFLLFGTKLGVSYDIKRIIPVLKYLKQTQDYVESDPVHIAELIDKYATGDIKLLGVLHTHPYDMIKIITKPGPSWQDRLGEDFLLPERPEKIIDIPLGVVIEAVIPKDISLEGLQDVIPDVNAYFYLPAEKAGVKTIDVYKVVNFQEWIGSRGNISAGASSSPIQQPAASLPVAYFDADQNKAMDLLRSDPRAWVVFSDMLKLSLRNDYYGTSISDFFIADAIRITKDVLGKQGGIGFRLGERSDEVAMVLPGYLQQEEVENVLQDIQYEIEKEYLDYCIARLPDGMAEKIKGSKGIRIAQRTARERREGDQEYITTVFFTKDSDDIIGRLTLDRILRESGQASGAGEVEQVLPPYLPAGAVRLRGEGVLENKLESSLKEAEIFQRVAKLAGQMVGVEGLNERPQIKEGAKLPDYAFSKLEEYISEFNESLQPLREFVKMRHGDNAAKQVQLDNGYAAFMRQNLFVVLEYAMEKMKSSDSFIFAVRGPPDNFYIITSGKGKWQVTAVRQDILTAEGETFEENFLSIIKSSGRGLRTAGRFPFKVINDFDELGHYFGNQLIKLDNINLLGSFNNQIHRAKDGKGILDAQSINDALSNASKNINNLLIENEFDFSVNFEAISVTSEDFAGDKSQSNAGISGATLDIIEKLNAARKTVEVPANSVKFYNEYKEVWQEIENEIGLIAAKKAKNAEIGLKETYKNINMPGEVLASSPVEQDSQKSLLELLTEKQRIDLIDRLRKLATGAKKPFDANEIIKIGHDIIDIWQGTKAISEKFSRELDAIDFLIQDSIPDMQKKLRPIVQDLKDYIKFSRERGPFSTREDSASSPATPETDRSALYKEYIERLKNKLGRIFTLSEELETFLARPDSADSGVWERAKSRLEKRLNDFINGMPLTAKRIETDSNLANRWFRDSLNDGVQNAWDAVVSRTDVYYHIIAALELIYITEGEQGLSQEHIKASYPVLSERAMKYFNSLEHALYIRSEYHDRIGKNKIKEETKRFSLGNARDYLNKLLELLNNPGDYTPIIQVYCELGEDDLGIIDVEPQEASRKIIIADNGLGKYAAGTSWKQESGLIGRNIYFGKYGKGIDLMNSAIIGVAQGQVSDLLYDQGDKRDTTIKFFEIKLKNFKENPKLIAVKQSFLSLADHIDQTDNPVASSPLEGIIVLARTVFARGSQLVLSELFKDYLSQRKKLLNLYDRVAEVAKKAAKKDFGVVLYPASGSDISAAVSFADTIVSIDNQDIFTVIDMFNLFFDKEEALREQINSYLEKKLELGFHSAGIRQGFIEYLAELVLLGADLSTLKIVEDRSVGNNRVTTVEFSIIYDNGAKRKIRHTHIKYVFDGQTLPGHIYSELKKVVGDRTDVLLLSKAGADLDGNKKWVAPISNILVPGTTIVSDSVLNLTSAKKLDVSGEDIRNLGLSRMNNYGYADKSENLGFYEIPVVVVTNRTASSPVVDTQMIKALKGIEGLEMKKDGETYKFEVQNRNNENWDKVIVLKDKRGEEIGFFELSTKSVGYPNARYIRITNGSYLNRGFARLILEEVRKVFPDGKTITTEIASEESLKELEKGRPFASIGIVRLFESAGWEFTDSGYYDGNGEYHKEPFGDIMGDDIRKGEEGVVVATFKAKGIQPYLPGFLPEEINESSSSIGGIDFRALPITSQPALVNQKVNANIIPPIPLAGLNSEWLQIENMLAAGITPSSERIKEYLQSCCQKQDFNQDIDKVLSCIANMLRLEEEQVASTDSSLKAMLVLLESGKPVNDMQLALAQITVEAKEPKLIEQ